MTSVAKRFFHIPLKLSEPELFRKMIKVSIGLHVAAILFFGLKASFFSPEAVDLDASIRVDMVGLPDKIATLPEEMKAPPKPEPKAAEKPIEPKIEAKPMEPKTAAPVVLHPKQNLKKAVERIREMEKEDRRKKALDAIQKQVKEEESAKERRASVERILKGNAVNSGSALHGIMKSDFNEYIGQLRNHVQQHWNLPEWLTNDSLKATVVVYLDYRGVVVKRTLQKGSGDERFDNYALQAIDQASPFPKPPPQFVDLVHSEGIVLGFPQ